MGFDLYGLNPVENSVLDEDAAKFQDEDGWARFDMMNDKDKDRYFKAQDKYHASNPGVYFRNNVWGWRPLWEYVCLQCEDILSHKDMVNGSYNDAHKISKTKSKKIAARLRKLIKNGYVTRYKNNRQQHIDELPLIECDICDGTGFRKKAPKTGAGDVECNGCNDGKKEQWETSYPFDTENVIRFSAFCEDSGGFEIC